MPGASAAPSLPAPVTATRTAPADSLTNTPTSAKRDAGLRNFTYDARLGRGNDTETITSLGLNAVSKRPVKNLSAGILRVLVTTVAPSYAN